MRILVTGAGGFVGNHLCPLLSSNGHEVLALDHSNKLKSKEIKSVGGDITDYDTILKIFNEFKPEAVYHLAGLAFIPLCEKDFQKTLDVNVMGTYNLLKASEKTQLLKKFILISTANVYGIVKEEDLPLTEDSPVVPNNNYAVSKLMAEEAVRKYERTHNIPCIIFRAFNHIGPGQAKEYVIPSFAYQISEIKKSESSETLKVGNLAAKRDFTDVRDIVDAYLLALEKGQGVYNLCSNNEISIEEIVNKLIKISGTGVDTEVDPERLRPNDLPVLKGDNSKVMKELGWNPKYSLDQTLEDIYKQFS